MRAVLFDLLSALIDSWSLWDDIAGSEERGRRWRFEYLRLTYGTGAYVPYLDLVEESAAAVGMPRAFAGELEARWDELAAWPGAGAAGQSYGLVTSRRVTFASMRNTAPERRCRQNPDSADTLKSSQGALSSMVRAADS